MQTPEKDQRWVPYADTQPQDCGAGVQRRVLAYTDGLMCVENTFEKGSCGAPHTHPHIQITYVLSGRFSFTVGGETRTVGPGDTLLVGSGALHGCDCLETGKVLDVFTPMREDFLPDGRK